MINSLKIKISCSAKDTVKKMKRQANKVEENTLQKRYISPLSDKGLVNRIFELSNFNSRKINSLTLKKGKRQTLYQTQYIHGEQAYKNTFNIISHRKLSFHSNPKERQCRRMFKLLHNYTHFTF